MVFPEENFRISNGENSLFGFSEAMGRFESDADRIERYLQNNLYFDMSYTASWGNNQQKSQPSAGRLVIGFKNYPP